LAPGVDARRASDPPVPQDLRFGGKVQQVLKAGETYAGPTELRGAKIPKPCASL
jgi:hypothetical protein